MLAVGEHLLAGRSLMGVDGLPGDEPAVAVQQTLQRPVNLLCGAVNESLRRRDIGCGGNGKRQCRRKQAAAGHGTPK
ncbi:hypothetical protein GCM10009661_60970 [Catellatospora chokoriensis]|uniref:Uncharacterized protein n=1 Tax=Catellatospora chokoriensis TaxID=310353 RepID=A0A8J3K953_9ACTN|nr:hypothetical protein Cch02nite_82670 [Catellatospora chokoriensis]